MATPVKTTKSVAKVTEVKLSGQKRDITDSSADKPLKKSKTEQPYSGAFTVELRRTDAFDKVCLTFLTCLNCLTHPPIMSSIHFFRDDDPHP